MPRWRGEATRTPTKRTRRSFSSTDMLVIKSSPWRRGVGRIPRLGVKRGGREDGSAAAAFSRPWSRGTRRRSTAACLSGDAAQVAPVATSTSCARAFGSWPRQSWRPKSASSSASPRGERDPEHHLNAPERVSRSALDTRIGTISSPSPASATARSLRPAGARRRTDNALLVFVQVAYLGGSAPSASRSSSGLSTSTS